eukprot:scaffold4442_cov125-Amphora_coffeaeformis.AAC.22
MDQEGNEVEEDLNRTNPFMRVTEAQRGQAPLLFHDSAIETKRSTKAKPFHHPKNIFAWYNNEGQIAWLNKKWSDRSAKLLPDASNVTTPHQLDLVSQPCIIPNGANHEILVSATSEQSMNAAKRMKMNKRTDTCIVPSELQVYIPWIKRNSVFSIFSFVCRGGMEPFLPMLGSTQFRKADP